MLNTSQAFKDAIVADSRKIKVRATMDIIDPDITYGTVTGSTQTAYSNSAQVHDGITELQPYATLEDNRWVLDGSFDIAHAGMTEQVGYESSTMSSTTNTLNISITMPIGGVSVLQALTLFFPTADYDGVPDSFTVDIYSLGTSYHTETKTGNTDSVLVFRNFTVYNPDQIRINVTKWSMPRRRVRIAEIFCGLREEWNNDRLAEFSLRQQVDFSCVSLPYGTATLTIDNSDKEFEPRAKGNLFQSLEERQGIKLWMGAAGAEYVPLGTFYMFSNGWKTSSNALTMEWGLVDIVGLLVDRQYVIPSPLPTTLEGWVADLVGQLGVNFSDAYIIDPNYSSTPLTVINTDPFIDKTCGQVLLWLCQASGVFPRADASTGKLALEPFWSQGNSITLDNLENYPTMSANKDVAFVRFTLPDSSVITVQGTSVSSPTTVEITNPFIQDQTAAAKAAREIISVYGGNLLTTLGRGDPSSEVGDVPTVQLDRSTATTGRLTYQDFIISDGVMKGCTSQLLQASGFDIYSTSEVFNTDGTWIAPAGVTEVKIILVGGGNGGGRGQDGGLGYDGAQGENGLGGNVYSSVINVNPGQSFAYTIGQGAAYGSTPTDTTFGVYSSADGHAYTPSYTDVQSGMALGRTGVANPTGNGDGGKGGAGGLAGSGYTQTTTKTTYTLYPDNGEPFEISEYVYNELCNYSPTGNPDDVISGHIVVDTQTTTQFIYTTYPTSGADGVAGADGVIVIYY